MEELAGKANPRDAGTTAGIATDKFLALTGESALTINVQHLVDPTEDDLIAFAIARSKSKPKSAKVIEAEPLPLGDTSIPEKNGA